MNRTPLTPTPLVYAHRGDRSRAPDNTLEAYGLAVEAGADGIELDVRRTADGVLIMSH
ncbi:MAG: glycerophosphodiester phosphodiesterase, partial [Actinomycetia bacterium]|nr:glycerophosphodiester phosphodiesterase [Actinomycetes bacterium]